MYFVVSTSSFCRRFLERIYAFIHRWLGLTSSDVFKKASWKKKLWVRAFTESFADVFNLHVAFVIPQTTTMLFMKQTSIYLPWNTYVKFKYFTLKPIFSLCNRLLVSFIDITTRKRGKQYRKDCYVIVYVVEENSNKLSLCEAYVCYWFIPSLLTLCLHCHQQHRERKVFCDRWFSWKKEDIILLIVNFSNLCPQSCLFHSLCRRHHPKGKRLKYQSCDEEERKHIIKYLTS